MCCKRFIFLLLGIAFVFTACGVETSSSVTSLTPDTGTDANTSTDTGTDANTSTDTWTDVNTSTDTGTDANTSTDTGNDTNTTSPDDGIISIFETNDAQLDTNACGASGYSAISDNSFDPEGFLDRENGIKILSVLPINFDPKKSEVVLYFPSFTQTSVNEFDVITEDFYWLSYDKTWVDNANNTVYMKIPTAVDGKYLCERLILNSTSASSISATKVYRETN